MVRAGAGRLVRAAGGRRRAAILAALVIGCASALVSVATFGNAGTATLTALDPLGDAPVQRSAAVDEVTVSQLSRPEVAVSIDGVLSWAYLNRTSGTLRTAANIGHRQSVESMIKAWLAADELARAETDGYRPNLDLIS